VVEPSTVHLENWHIDLIADYLQAVTADPDYGGSSSTCRKIDLPIDHLADPGRGRANDMPAGRTIRPRGPGRETGVRLDAKSAIAP
jgi:hypothetical protein